MASFTKFFNQVWQRAALQVFPNDVLGGLRVDEDTDSAMDAAKKQVVKIQTQPAKRLTASQVDVEQQHVES